VFVSFVFQISISVSLAAGVSIVRVHDVAEMIDVAKVANAITSAGSVLALQQEEES